MDDKCPFRNKAECENILAAVYSAYCTNLWHQRVSNIRAILFPSTYSVTLIFQFMSSGEAM